jgi:dipeptidase E
MILAPSIDYAAEYDNPTMAPNLTDHSALGVVDFYPCPHHTNPPFKRAVERIINRYESDRPLRPMSNKQAILVNGSTVSLESA